MSLWHVVFVYYIPDVDVYKYTSKQWEERMELIGELCGQDNTLLYICTCHRIT